MVIDEIQLTRHISQVKGIGFDVATLKWMIMFIQIQNGVV